MKIEFGSKVQKKIVKNLGKNTDDSLSKLLKLFKEKKYLESTITFNFI